MAKESRTPLRKLKDVVIDVLVNSAGIAGVPGQKTGNVDYKFWAQVLNVNTMGPLRVLESFCDHIGGSERRLVMRSAAIDLAPRGITCVLVNPGWVRTDMGGPKAPLSPQESVTAMRRLIETFGPNQSGKFYNYDGREYPW